MVCTYTRVRGCATGTAADVKSVCVCVCVQARVWKTGPSSENGGSLAPPVEKNGEGASTDKPRASGSLSDTHPRIGPGSPTD